MATLVYIHGESYEWNSGNLYDGTVLAAHSNIIVVTINFRIGVLGEFLFLPCLIPLMCVYGKLPRMFQKAIYFHIVLQFTSVSK
jgi:hypothetical protein